MDKLGKIEKLVKKGKADKLAAMTHGTDKEIRIAAISGLEKLIENEAALNCLVGLMEDADADVRKAAVSALGAASGSYVETRLRYCLGHENDGAVLEAAAASLAKMGK